MSWKGPQRTSKEPGAFVEVADDNGATCTSVFYIDNRLLRRRFDGRQSVCFLLLLMLLDEQFLDLVLPVVEGVVGNPLSFTVSQRRKTAGSLVFDDFEPLL